MRRFVLTTFGTLIGCTLFAAALLPAGMRIYLHQTRRLAILETELVQCRETAGEACRAGSAQERVVDLPEDGHQWHTILLLCADWKQRPAERRAEALFHSEPLLVSLKHQTHWHLITSDQSEFAKFRALVDATPCLIVERANGEVVYRESGPQLGLHSRSLVRAIEKEIQRHCPDGRCLPLHPVPGENDRPDEIPAVLREEAPPEKRRGSPLPVALTAVAAMCAGFAWKFKRAAGV